MSAIPPPPEPSAYPMTSIGGAYPDYLAKVRRDHNGRWVYGIFRNGTRDQLMPPPPWTFRTRRAAARAARREARRLNRIASRPDLSTWRSA